MNINEFSENLIDFDVSFVESSETIWTNNKNFEENGDSLYCCPLMFKNVFSFVKSDDKCFVDLNYSDENKKTYKAERYGGEGIGQNGGGVRCGNNGKYQIKGIGVTQVVGMHNDFDHSSGMYPLFEAVTEAVNSLIYAHILPIGVVPYLGIINLGESAHKLAPERGAQQLAVGVRESCLRPAHFLRAGFYKIHTKYRDEIINDTSRVRAVNRSLRHQLGGNDKFIKLIGEFLSSSANQFAFSKVFRVSHGAVTASNLCIDGRWLDLTNASFVPGGMNYSAGEGATPFLNEPFDVIGIVQEFIYTYCKYNYTDLNISPLINYYYEQFNAYYNYHIVALLGFSQDDCCDAVYNDDKVVMCNLLNRVFHDHSEPLRGFPKEIIANDPIVDMVEELFYSIIKSPVNIPYLKNNEIVAFSNLLFRSFSASNYSHLSDYFISTAIKSFRKLYFSPMFYVGRIQEQTRILLKNKNSIEYNEYINLFENIAIWVFDGLDNYNEVVLFSSTEVFITFKPHEGLYSLKLIKEGEKNNFADSHGLLVFLHGMDNSKFVLTNFNFKPHLIKMCTMFSELAKIQDSPINM